MTTKSDNHCRSARITSIRS